MQPGGTAFICASMIPPDCYTGTSKIPAIINIQSPAARAEHYSSNAKIISIVTIFVLTTNHAIRCDARHDFRAARKDRRFMVPVLASQSHSRKVPAGSRERKACESGIPFQIIV